MHMDQTIPTTCSSCGSINLTRWQSPHLAGTWLSSGCSDPEARYEAARALALPILKALGIDPKGVLSFTLRMAGGELPRVEVTRAVPRGAGEAAANVLEAYQVVQRGPTAAVGDLDESVSLSSPVVTTHRHPHSQGCDRP